MHTQAGLIRLMLVVGLSLLTAGSLRAAEGFGMSKKDVTLVRTNPPAFYIMGVELRVAAQSDVQGKANLANQVRDFVEAQLLKREQGRLKVATGPPQTQIDLNIARCDVSEEWQTRKGIERRKVGEYQEYNQATGKKETKDRYADVEVTNRYQVVQGNLTMTAKVTDSKTKENYADTLNVRRSNEYLDGNGAPPLSTLEDEMVRDAATQLVNKLTRTQEALQVLLPKDSLDDLGKLAEAGLWNRYQEKLESLPAKGNPKDEAYRQYALGVCYEALGYQTEDPQMTLKYLEKAAEYYNKALDAKPEEKFFSQAWRTEMPPLQRVQSSLTQYQRLAELIDKWNQSQAQVAAAEATDGKGVDNVTISVECPEDGVMRNCDIVKLVKAGFPDENVISMIDGATKTEFDVSAPGMIKLKDFGVSFAIITYLQKLGIKKKPAATPPAAAKRKKPTSN